MLALWNHFDDLARDEFLRPRLRKTQAGYLPPVDLRENEDGYEIQADLPGLTADDVEITVENGVLTLSGKRNQEKREEKDGYQRIERSFGGFRRSFTLPKGVNTDAIEAKVEHGELTVQIPKPEEVTPKKLKVKQD